VSINPHRARDSLNAPPNTHPTTQNQNTKQALQTALEQSRKEGKTKGDLARRLLEEKDKEIAALRATLERRYGEWLCVWMGMDGWVSG
jgi:hypothetical protein